MSLTRGHVLTAFEVVEDLRLEASLPEGSLLVESLSRSKKWFASIDSEGSWTLVVGSRKSSGKPPALRLSSLQADYGATYQLHQGLGTESLRASVIRCTSTEHEIRKLFATFCIAILEAMPNEPYDVDVEAQVNKWTSLFWRLREPARTSVVGLIGELTLLDAVERTSDWVRAWHADPGDNVDFAFNEPALSVEVKATSGQQRVHEISIHQASPIVTDHHYFASVVVEFRDTGDRVGDVVDRIAERLDSPSALNQFWRVLSAVCGSALTSYLEIRFMSAMARKSLQFYDSGSVPRPEMALPLPAGVSGVRFQSDFSSVAPVNPGPIVTFSVDG